MEFFDAGTSDLRELWESYLAEPALGQDMAMATRDEEWGSVLCPREKTLGVVLRDRLMTDAALGGTRPIKSEHSYSLLASSPPQSPATPGNSSPHLPDPGTTVNSTTTSINTLHHNHKHQSLEIRSRMDDMDEECFPAISLNTASGRGAESPSPSPSPPPASASPTSTPSACRLITVVPENERTTLSEGIVKEEPLSLPASPCPPCPTYAIVDEKPDIIMMDPQRLHFSQTHTSDSEDDDEEEEYYQSMELEDSNGLVENASDGVSGSGSGTGMRQVLPPTPPSSASSDSESAVSASCSPERRDSHVQNLRGLLTPRLYVTNGGTVHTHATRQPIHTPLISCQPKGSTGILTLTEEEKRTLIAEGYPVPTKLPLTKQEEKSLKKVRRKIKNKISAQESRRKKKEYMDGLERRVTMLANENSSYRDRLTTLEGTNRQLVRELQRLQAILQH